MAAPRMHYYLITATLSYVREEANKQRQMNMILATQERRITIDNLEHCKTLLGQRLHGEMGVLPDDVKDFVFTNIAWLGHMSEREFNGAKHPSEQPLHS